LTLQFGRIRGKEETTPKRRRQARQEPVNKRLQKMQEIGQSVWVDSISLRALQSGEFERMLEDSPSGYCSAN
jgi:hypothetical protein